MVGISRLNMTDLARVAVLESIYCSGDAQGVTSLATPRSLREATILVAAWFQLKNGEAAAQVVASSAAWAGHNDGTALHGFCFYNRAEFVQALRMLRPVLQQLDDALCLFAAGYSAIYTKDEDSYLAALERLDSLEGSNRYASTLRAVTYFYAGRDKEAAHCAVQVVRQGAPYPLLQIACPILAGWLGPKGAAEELERSPRTLGVQMALLMLYVGLEEKYTQIRELLRPVLKRVDPGGYFYIMGRYLDFRGRTGLAAEAFEEAFSNGYFDTAWDVMRGAICIGRAGGVARAWELAQYAMKMAPDDEQLAHYYKMVERNYLEHAGRG